jgi:hypothetical protein
MCKTIGPARVQKPVEGPAWHDVLRVRREAAYPDYGMLLREEAYRHAKCTAVDSKASTVAMPK